MTRPSVDELKAVKARLDGAAYDGDPVYVSHDEMAALRRLSVPTEPTLATLGCIGSFVGRSVVVDPEKAAAQRASWGPIEVAS